MNQKSCITFDNLCFVDDPPDAGGGTDMPTCSNAVINIGNYTFSVVRGGISYSTSNTYELAIIDKHTGEFVDIGRGDVNGWLTVDDINMLMNQAAHEQPLELID